MSTGTAISFVSSEPHITVGIVITHPENQPPTELINALRAVGWQTDADRGYLGAPALDGEEETAMSKPGDALFGGWERDETHPNLLQARKIMAELGFTDVPRVALTWADCI